VELVLFYIFDLAVDPTLLSGLTDVQLAARLGESPKPLRRVRTNAAPIILPADEAPRITSALRLGDEEIERRMAFLNSRKDLIKRIVAAFDSIPEKRVQSPYVERQLYDGFFSDDDHGSWSNFTTRPGKTEARSWINLRIAAFERSGD
jgi:exodeoxyribonuclease I